jgi:hypothetical protein
MTMPEHLSRNKEALHILMTIFIGSFKVTGKFYKRDNNSKDWEKKSNRSKKDKNKNKYKIKAQFCLLTWVIYQNGHSGE